MLAGLALVVGAMKCGTTSLFHYLQDHPELAPCKTKDSNFFSDDARWKRGPNWYESLFNFNSNSQRFAFEACPAYTTMPFGPDCAERIASLGTPTKIIYAIRDPIARIESHYTMARARGWPDTGRGPSYGIHPKVIAFSSYAMQIERYYRRFDANDIKIIRLEDLRADAERQLIEICRFLGIAEDHSFGGLEKAHKASREMTQVPAWYSALTSAKTLKRIATSVPGKRWIGRKLLGLHDVTPTVLSEQQREETLGLLRDDMIKLQDKYGIDTTDWR